MGYELHLVKNGDHPRAELFTPEEWESLTLDAGAPDGMIFADGEVTLKSPSRDQVIAMVRFAMAHGCSVQGDDGEWYDDRGSPLQAEGTGQRPGRPTVLGEIAARVIGWFTIGPERPHARTAAPFAVGDRVRTHHRQGGIVIEVDPAANHAMGAIRAQFPDGAVIVSVFAAHPFMREEPTPER